MSDKIKYSTFILLLVILVACIPNAKTQETQPTITLTLTETSTPVLTATPTVTATTMPTNTPIPTKTPIYTEGIVLFEDNFDNGMAPFWIVKNNGGEWKLVEDVEGNLFLSGEGNYILSGEDTSQEANPFEPRLFITGIEWKNYLIEFMAKVVSKSTTNFQFAVPIEGGPAGCNFFDINFGTGGVNAAKITSSSSGCQENPYPIIQQEPMAIGTWNTIRIAIFENQIVILVNGKKVLDIEEADFWGKRSFSIVMSYHTEIGEPAIVHFDNFRVIELAPRE